MSPREAQCQSSIEWHGPGFSAVQSLSYLTMHSYVMFHDGTFETNRGQESCNLKLFLSIKNSRNFYLDSPPARRYDEFTLEIT